MAEASSPHGHQGEEAKGQGPNRPFEGMPSDLRKVHFKCAGLRGHFRSRLQHYRLKISVNQTSNKGF